MKWSVSAKAEPGDVRVIKRFLLFPKRIGTEVRWLETAWVRQRYDPFADVSPAGTLGVQYLWADIGWGDGKEEVKGG